jgi:hypothetical protein
MRRWDIACTAVITALGMVVVWEGWRLGFGAFESPGPGFIAVFAGLFLFLFSTANMVLTVAKYQKRADRPFWPETDSLRKVLLTLAGPIAFVLLLNYLGFFLCSLGMLIYLFRIIYPHRISLTLFLALATALACLILFQFILKVQFPQGVINFYHVKGWLF